jgi:Mrp family chromosome partitioning ATPase
MLHEVSCAPAVQSLCERLAPLANVGSQVRLALTGCRKQDGTSTIAAAIAVDLSQRLGIPTLLVDAHLGRPMLHRFFAVATGRAPEVVVNDYVLMQPTGRTRLELASCLPLAAESLRAGSCDELEELLAKFPAVVADLGVIRLDARMLALARTNDPLIIVARYGSTQRQELTNTALSLRAAKRTIAGVMVNGVSRPIHNSAASLLNSGFGLLGAGADA